MSKQQIIILTTSIITLFAVVGGGLFYFKNNFDLTPKNTNSSSSQSSNAILSSSNLLSSSDSVISRQSSATNQSVNSNSSVSSLSKTTQSNQPTTNTNSPKLEGKYEKINQDLGIFIPDNPAEMQYGKPRTPEYYKAGKILSGKYAGYDRIAMVIPNGQDLSSKARYIFLTKDYKSYIYESTADIDINDSDKSFSAFSNFNKDKTSPNTREIDTGTNLASVINFNEGLVLTRNRYQSVPNLSKLKLIKEIGSLKFYDDGNTSQYDRKFTNTLPTFDAFGSNRAIWVADETGLTLSYMLTFDNRVKNYSANYTKFITNNTKQTQDSERYYKINEEERTKEPICQTTEYDKCNDIIIPKTEARFGGKVPKLSYSGIQFDTNFSSKDIQGTTNLKSFAKEYSHFVYTPCGQFGDPFYSNNPPVNPMEVGKLYGQTPLYISSDQTLAKAHYKAKYGDMTDPLTRKNIEATIESKIPTEQEFLAKNNILWFKDAFGRWIITAELLEAGGGCGKPVVYLYPEVPTDISVRFDKSVEPRMQLDVQIPSYGTGNQSKGWLVNAQPNGQLKDLQPKITNCSDFGTGRKGQEYALKSCQNNNYPYIYWAGNTPNQYPKIESGFVVSAKDLESELRSKLAIIGLNKQETDDMMEYWLPNMLSKNKPFYRFSLLQNNELDKLFPMTISPQPQSSIRVFLDWDALDTNTTIPTQELITYSRTGYTMVEWGGVKK